MKTNGYGGIFFFFEGPGGVFVHPVAGPLTVAQAIRLGQIHLDVHARQISLLCRLLA